MTLMLQVTLGAVLLGLCALVHVAVVALSIPMLGGLSRALEQGRPVIRNTLMLCFGVAAVVLAHTIQIWGWALAFYLVRAFVAFDAAFYFSTVTYTTLGYGDLVLPDGLRIFGTFAAITGLLTFGISTAFLIGVIVRLMPDQFRTDAPRGLGAHGERGRDRP